MVRSGPPVSCILFLIAVVLQCDFRIAFEHFELGPLDGAALEDAAIVGDFPVKQFVQQRMRARRADIESRFRIVWGRLVEGADFLADVAAEHPVADRAVELRWNIAPKLDGYWPRPSSRGFRLSPPQ